VQRGCGVGALLTAAATLALFAWYATSGADLNEFAGGWHWTAASLAAVEGTLAIGASV
jgi:hypothetical protein